MFGWERSVHYTAQANREKLGMSRMEKIVTFDQSQSLDDFMPVPEADGAWERRGNIPGQHPEKSAMISGLNVCTGVLGAQSTAAMGLILLDFFDFEGIGISQFVSQIVSKSPRGQTSHSSFNGPSIPSRQITPQNGSDPLQRPVDLIAGNHEWRGDADRVSMGVLGKNPPALQRFTIATRIASFRVEFDRQHQPTPTHLTDLIGAYAP
jgi:hypothetical protein